ncbi:MAG: prolyl-tRNA synthetase associated domain-containing protein [Acidobacteriota bacterium]
MVEDPARPVLELLDSLGIGYQRFDHPPVFTVEQAVEQWKSIDATHCKNLFLRNKKGNRHYLVVAEHSRPVDLRRVAEMVGDDRLSFGSPERLARVLGLTPGSVSPFGLINDHSHDVHVVVVDADLRAARCLGFHPNTNTATLTLSAADFARFLAWSGHVVRWVTLTS